MIGKAPPEKAFIFFFSLRMLLKAHEVMWLLPNDL